MTCNGLMSLWPCEIRMQSDKEHIVYHFLYVSLQNFPNLLECHLPRDISSCHQEARKNRPEYPQIPPSPWLCVEATTRNTLQALSMHKQRAPPSKSPRQMSPNNQTKLHIQKTANNSLTAPGLCHIEHRLDPSPCRLLLTRSLDLALNTPRSPSSWFSVETRFVA